jgi:thioester reductase-like protein
VLDEWRSIRPAQVERQRLGDVIADHSGAREDRWSRLANRVDRVIGSPAWRHYLRPAMRAIRSLK